MAEESLDNSALTFVGRRRKSESLSQHIDQRRSESSDDNKIELARNSDAMKHKQPLIKS